MYSVTKEANESLEELIVVMDLIRDEVKVRKLLGIKQTYASRVALIKLLKLLQDRRHNKYFT